MCPGLKRLRRLQKHSRQRGRKNTRWTSSLTSCIRAWIAKVRSRCIFKIQYLTTSSALTIQQFQRLVELARSQNLPLPQSDVSPLFDASDPSVSTELLTPLSQDSSMRFPERALNASQGDKPHAENPLDALAREFGVDAHVVQALAQRLAELC